MSGWEGDCTVYLDNSKVTDAMPIAFAYHRILFNVAQKPVDFEFLDMNPAYEAITGLQKSDAIGKSLLQVVPDIRKKEFDWIAECAYIALKGRREKFEQYSEILDRWFEVSIIPTETHCFYVFFEDITPHIVDRQEKEIIIEAMNELLFVVDEDFVCTQVFVSRDSQLFIPRQEVLGRNINDLFPEDFSELLIGAYRKARDTGVKERLEYQMSLTDDCPWYEIEAFYRETALGKYYITRATNITEQKNKETELAYANLHDPLTGLFNRNALRILKARLAGSHRKEDVKSAICVDIDNFRMINDALGHRMGDQFIIDFSRKITDCVSDKGSVYRNDGDEFVVITDSTEFDSVYQIANDILRSVSSQLTIHHRMFCFTASIGMCVGSPERTLEQTVKNADTALYVAKSDMNTIRIYSGDMENARYRGSILREDLRYALERGQFEIYYQPIYDVREGVINQAEAILRWNHPEFGQILPAEFIPIAERTRLILPITDWVIDQVCQKISIWNDLGGSIMAVSVNISSVSVEKRGDELAGHIQQAIQNAGINPSSLKLEITESALMRDIDEIMKSFRGLKQIGVKLALDDFGTGYSSFGYMKDLPLDIIKLDRSLISNILTDEREQMILPSLVSIIHGLALEVVVEGVETKEQYNMLSNYQCDYLQGYLFSRPLPVEQFEQYFLRLKN